jgi:tetratricopeptide (TPR) repeat protein
MLVIFPLIAFWHISLNSFVYDDDQYIVNNPNINKGLSIETLKWSFTSTYASNWHPLTWISHTLDCSIFGLKPAGHHLVSLFFHILSSIILFIIFSRLSKRLFVPYIIAALFAVHPLRVESVAWIAERKDVLSTFFLMLSVMVYISFTDKKSYSKYFLSLFFFALGLLSKPMIVTLPIILLLLDYWPLNRFGILSFSKLVLEKIPFVILSAISSIVTIYAQKQGGSVAELTNVPLIIRLSNAATAFIQYICKIFFPANLSPFYPHPLDALPLWQVIFSALILIILTSVFFYYRKKLGFLIVGWLWFIITLIPVIGIIQVGDQAMADRYTYLPSIGILIIVVFSLAKAVEKFPKLKIPAASIAIIVLTVLTILTINYVNIWREKITLYSHAVKVTQNNYIMHNNLGAVLLKNNKVDEAVEHFQTAVEINPNYYKAANNIGRVFAQKGLYDQAIAEHKKVLALDPNNLDALNSIGACLTNQAKIDEAARYFYRAIEINPDYKPAQHNLSILQDLKKQPK